MKEVDCVQQRNTDSLQTGGQQLQQHDDDALNQPGKRSRINEIQCFSDGVRVAGKLPTYNKNWSSYTVCPKNRFSYYIIIITL